MLSQSTPKTIFLLVSMVGWLIVGAVLIYLFPAAANWINPGELTDRWMETLSRGSYDPNLATVVGSVTLAVTVVANIVWYQWFDERF
ncbi:MAG: hypothetical protein AAGF66_09660 [Cyanobacteria bacterium P01_H01_bin.119]